MENVVTIGKNTITTEEYLAPGHRACLGCGEELAVRLVTKALGKDIIIANATGCTEIVSSPFPYTSWRVPFFHSAFENSAATICGVEAMYQSLKRKGKLPVFTQRQRHDDYRRWNELDSTISGNTVLKNGFRAQKA